MRVLFVTSEVFPLIKTGGLADVSGSLPSALQNLGVDIRILVPGYPSVLKQLDELHHLVSLKNLPVIENADLLMGTILETNIKVMVIKAPGLYERDGGPYVDITGQEWLDNPVRFGVLSKVASMLSGANSPINNWNPNIVHCNDWQTGLAPAYMNLVEHSNTKSMISLHNMAFQGCYAPGWLTTLGLPQSSFTLDGLEYHHQLSFLKASTVFFAL